jgi:hypothetical protein
MKKISIIIGICFLFAFDSIGQQVRGKVLINRQEFKDKNDTSTYFTFKPLKAKLSKQGRRYLDNFATYLSSKQTKQNDSLSIVIDPASTFKEQKVINNQIGLARGMTAHEYLKENYGIEIESVKIRETTTACVLTGTINKTRKEKRK